MNMSENVLSMMVRQRGEHTCVLNGGPTPRFVSDERLCVNALARYKELASRDPIHVLDMSARDLGGLWGDVELSSEVFAALTLCRRVGQRGSSDVDGAYMGATPYLILESERRSLAIMESQSKGFLRRCLRPDTSNVAVMDAYNLVFKCLGELKSGRLQAIAGRSTHRDRLLLAESTIFAGASPTVLDVVSLADSLNALGRLHSAADAPDSASPGQKPVAASVQSVSSWCSDSDSESSDSDTDDLDGMDVDDAPTDDCRARLRRLRDASLRKQRSFVRDCVGGVVSDASHNEVYLYLGCKLGRPQGLLESAMEPSMFPDSHAPGSVPAVPECAFNIAGAGITRDVVYTVMHAHRTQGSDERKAVERKARRVAVAWLNVTLASRHLQIARISRAMLSVVRETMPEASATDLCTSRFGDVSAWPRLIAASPTLAVIRHEDLRETLDTPMTFMDRAQVSSELRLAAATGSWFQQFESHVRHLSIGFETHEHKLDRSNSRTLSTELALRLAAQFAQCVLLVRHLDVSDDAGCLGRRSPLRALASTYGPDIERGTPYDVLYETFSDLSMSSHMQTSWRTACAIGATRPDCAHVIADTLSRFEDVAAQCAHSVAALASTLGKNANAEEKIRDRMLERLVRDAYSDHYAHTAFAYVGARLVQSGDGIFEAGAGDNIVVSRNELASLVRIVGNTESADWRVAVLGLIPDELLTSELQSRVERSGRGDLVDAASPELEELLHGAAAELVSIAVSLKAISTSLCDAPVGALAVMDTWMDADFGAAVRELRSMASPPSFVQCAERLLGCVGEYGQMYSVAKCVFWATSRHGKNAPLCFDTSAFGVRMHAVARDSCPCDMHTDEIRALPTWDTTPAFFIMTSKARDAEMLSTMRRVLARVERTMRRHGNRGAQASTTSRSAMVAASEVDDRAIVVNLQSGAHLHAARSSGHVYIPAAESRVIDFRALVRAVNGLYERNFTNLEAVYKKRTDTQGTDMASRSIVGVYSSRKRKYVAHTTDIRAKRVRRGDNKDASAEGADDVDEERATRSSTVLVHGNLVASMDYIMPLALWPFLQIVYDISAYARAALRETLVAQNAGIDATVADALAEQLKSEVFLAMGGACSLDEKNLATAVRQSVHSTISHDKPGMVIVTDRVRREIEGKAYTPNRFAAGTVGIDAADMPSDCVVEDAKSGKRFTPSPLTNFVIYDKARDGVNGEADSFEMLVAKLLCTSSATTRGFYGTKGERETYNFRSLLAYELEAASNLLWLAGDPLAEERDRALLVVYRTMCLVFDEQANVIDAHRTADSNHFLNNAEEMTTEGKVVFSYMSHAVRDVLLAKTAAQITIALGKWCDSTLGAVRDEPTRRHLRAHTLPEEAFARATPDARGASPRLFFGKYYEWTSFAKICALSNAEITALGWSPLDEREGARNRIRAERQTFQKLAAAALAEQDLTSDPPSLAGAVVELRRLQRPKTSKSLPMHAALRNVA